MNHIIYDGGGFVISLHFSAPIICVTIQGRELDEMYRKLLDDEIDWVQEFDARKWDTPLEGQPCITGIEVSHALLPRKADAAEEDRQVLPVAMESRETKLQLTPEQVKAVHRLHGEAFGDQTQKVVSEPSRARSAEKQTNGCRTGRGLHPEPAVGAAGRL